MNQEEYNEIIYMQKIGHNYFVLKNFDNSKYNQFSNNE